MSHTEIDIGYTTRGWLNKQIDKVIKVAEKRTFEEEIALAVTKAMLNTTEFNPRSQDSCDKITHNINKMVNDIAANVESK